LDKTGNGGGVFGPNDKGARGDYYGIVGRPLCPSNVFGEP
jgi:hypothetical protein